MAHILLLRPDPGAVPTGNRITALRWAALWRRDGHRVRIRAEDDGKPADVVVALHAERSGPALLAADRRLPRALRILALSGTDWNGPEAGPRAPLSEAASAALERADHLVVLQPSQGAGLPKQLTARQRVVWPSGRVVTQRPPPRELRGEVWALGHLRPVKDPFLLWDAMERLPPDAPVVAVHAGAALTEEMAREARARSGARWRWVGPLAHRQAIEGMARGLGLVLTSKSEGASTAIVEALVHGVPVLATDIASNRALLGSDWPGLFAPGDAAALAGLLLRLSGEPSFGAKLSALALRLAPRHHPDAEAAAWRSLLSPS